MAKKIATRSFDFPQWYQDVLAAAPDLYDESPVTGCITFGPLSTQLWDGIHSFVQQRIERMGVENIMLPTLIPESFFAREKKHVEGFAPEVAVVTHAGGGQLPEPYYVRPTSELLFVDWFTRNGRVQSHRDLPLLVNQWCSVMRWEKRPRAFLRTSEFHWQEGHCLFPTEERCRAFTLGILDMYAETAEKLLAIPVLKGEKPAHEIFPGAISTFTIESMMQDGKALQMGTSHMLSQNFLSDDDRPLVSFLDKEGQTQIPFYDSWGISTRLLGAVIMAHGDDDGIVLPPRVAPVQVTILPILGSDEMENENVMRVARSLALTVANTPSPFADDFSPPAHATGLYPLHGRSNWFEQAVGTLRVRVDTRLDTRLGEKTFYQIHSGTPVRVEIGARELAQNQCIIKSRIRGRDDALKVSLEQAPNIIAMMLRDDQATLFDRAKNRQETNTVRPRTYPELKKALAEGLWAEVPWDGTKETVAKLKADTGGATYRCFPFDCPLTAKDEIDPVSGNKCPFAKRIVVAKAY